MSKTTSYIILQDKFLMKVTTNCDIPDNYLGAEIEICIRHKQSFTDSANLLATEISDLLRKSLCPVKPVIRNIEEIEDDLYTQLLKEELSYD